VQAIGLILSNPPSIPKEGSAATTDAEVDPQITSRTTLIVCPVSVMANWSIQIKKFVNSGSGKPYLILDRLHGTKKERKAVLHRVMSNEIDVVLTSYQTLATDFNSFVKKNNSDATISSEERTAPKSDDKTVFDYNFYRIVLDEGM
jgi:SNF2 family DNA or RNA helicase